MCEHDGEIARGAGSEAADDARTGRLVIFVVDHGSMRRRRGNGVFVLESPLRVKESVQFNKQEDGSGVPS